MVNPDKVQQPTSKTPSLEEIVKTMVLAIKKMSYKIARDEKGIPVPQTSTQPHNRLTFQHQGRNDDKWKWKVGGNEKPPLGRSSANNSREVPDPLASRVVNVEEVRK